MLGRKRSGRLWRHGLDGGCVAGDVVTWKREPRFVTNFSAAFRADFSCTRSLAASRPPPRPSPKKAGGFASGERAQCAGESVNSRGASGGRSTRGRCARQRQYESARGVQAGAARHYEWRRQSCFGQVNLTKVRCCALIGTSLVALLRQFHSSFAACLLPVSCRPAPTGINRCKLCCLLLSPVFLLLCSVWAPGGAAGRFCWGPCTETPDQAAGRDLPRIRAGYSTWTVSTRVACPRAASVANPRRLAVRPSAVPQQAEG